MLHSNTQTLKKENLQWKERHNLHIFASMQLQINCCVAIYGFVQNFIFLFTLYFSFCLIIEGLYSIRTLGKLFNIFILPKT